MALLFSHLSVCLTHVYNFKSVFNFTITKLSWHVLCYLISKNLYSLQNTQPFIIQLICMQLYKCLNCFLKVYNKQLNQYCLNFTFFFYYQKKKFKKMVRVRVRSGWTAKKIRVGSRVNPFLLQVKKKKKKSGSGRVFFRLGQKILTRFTMSREVLANPCQEKRGSPRVFFFFFPQKRNFWKQLDRSMVSCESWINWSS